MTQKQYLILENYMLSCMEDSAHDAEHIYRVLYNALQIAKAEENVNYDILITACLLHDIGRREQFADHSLCHAVVGAEKACRFLLEQGYAPEFAEAVAHAIRTHRFRKAMQPETLEAKILFDADKLDVTGAIGIARTLMYKADMAEPLYHMLPDGRISDGTEDLGPSFFREYKFKLETMYDRFSTKTGETLARHRQRIAADFYESLYREVNTGYTEGKTMLQDLMEES